MQAEGLAKLARMELSTMKGFQACAKNLSVIADMPFAARFFLHRCNAFQTALPRQVVTCLLIQALLIRKPFRDRRLSHLHSRRDPLPA